MGLMQIKIDLGIHGGVVAMGIRNKYSLILI